MDTYAGLTEAQWQLVTVATIIAGLFVVLIPSLRVKRVALAVVLVAIPVMAVVSRGTW